MVNVPLEAISRSSVRSTMWEVVNVPEHVQTGLRGTLTMRWGGRIARSLGSLAGNRRWLPARS
jgi:hypothetical protein